MADLFGLPLKERAGYCYEDFKRMLTKKTEELESVKYVLFQTFRQMYQMEWFLAVFLYV